jgi:hypothetical protein
MSDLLGATAWIDDLNDCVQRYDPANLISLGVGYAVKGIGVYGVMPQNSCK